MQRTLTIGIIGDYDPELRYHQATLEALNHAAAELSIIMTIEWISTQALAHGRVEQRLRPYHAFWGAPGDITHMKGALEGIRFAREQGRPFIGTCGGFQHAVIEYARNVVGIANAEHEETSPNAPTLLIRKLRCSLVGKQQDVHIASGTKTYQAYDKTITSEQFVCNYGLNHRYRNQIETAPLLVSGVDGSGEVRIIELNDHPFFIATLFQPQISSQPGNPHPLIVAYLNAAHSEKKCFYLDIKTNSLSLPHADSASHTTGFMEDRKGDRTGRPGKHR